MEVIDSPITGMEGNREYLFMGGLERRALNAIRLNTDLHRFHRCWSASESVLRFDRCLSVLIGVKGLA